MPADHFDLKPDPRYGFFPRWPEDGDEWLHPEDVELARSMIPSERVFRREELRGPLAVLVYGELRIRIKPALWQEVASEGYEIGDWVEVLSRMGQNERRTGVIREMVWNAHEHGLRYQIYDNGKPIENFYSADDIRHVEPITEKLDR